MKESSMSEKETVGALVVERAVRRAFIGSYFERTRFIHVPSMKDLTIWVSEEHGAIEAGHLTAPERGGEDTIIEKIDLPIEIAQRAEAFRQAKSELDQSTDDIKMLLQTRRHIPT